LLNLQIPNLSLLAIEHALEYRLILLVISVGNRIIAPKHCAYFPGSAIGEESFCLLLLENIFQISAESVFSIRGPRDKVDGKRF
jgi:hypothetical protein